MRRFSLLSFLSLACFSALPGQQNLVGDSVFQALSARLLAKKGMERVKLLDTLYRELSVNNLEKTIALQEEALAILDTAKIPGEEKLTRQAILLRRIGACKKSLYRYPEAFSFFEKSARKADELAKMTGKPVKEKAWALTSMGDVSSNLPASSFETAFSFFREADEIYRKCADTAGLVFNFDVMSRMAFDHSKTEEAMRCAREGLALAKIKRPPLVPVFQKAIGEAFLRLEQPDSAIFYFEKVLPAYQSPAAEIHQAIVFIRLADAHFLKKDWSKTLEMLDAFEVLSKRHELTIGMYTSFYWLKSDTYKQMGKYREALEFFEKHKMANDSTAKLMADGNLAHLQTEYEMEKKDQKIALLKAESEAKTLRQWLLLAVLGLVSVGGWLVFRWFLKKRKAENALLVEQNTQLQERFDRLLALHFAEKTPIPGNADDEFLSRLLLVLENNLTDENFSVESLPRELGISRAQFFKKIKELTGKTPAELLRKIRLEKARHLLESGNSNVSDVAFSVGFSNADSFGRAFREYFGENPSGVLRKRRNGNGVGSERVSG